MTSYNIPTESEPKVNVDKRVHSLSLLRTRYAPQNYFTSNSYSTPEVSQQRRLNKRVHHLSLLRMGKLFKPNTAPQVKRLAAESLWRYLASDSLKSL
uniref:Uncharacterized protein n=1 Tax=Panagrolaimus sp. PS1159 TaxID=55785 RepID=A0AC35FY34_9BILA